LVSALADTNAKVKLMEHLRPPNQNFDAAHTLSSAQINAVLAGMPEASRMSLLSDVCSLVDLPRQMLNAAELASLQSTTFVLGAHGYSHSPLTAVAEPERELEVSFQWLKSKNCTPLSMSFPHGAYDANLVQLAKFSGFQWIFTSDPELTPTAAIADGAITLGRIHIPENQWTCIDGKISYPLLATFLFFRPKAIAQ